MPHSTTRTEPRRAYPAQTRLDARYADSPILPRPALTSETEPVPILPEHTLASHGKPTPILTCLPNRCAPSVTLTFLPSQATRREAKRDLAADCLSCLAEPHLALTSYTGPADHGR
jgi:hypothetical protein